MLSLPADVVCILHRVSNQKPVVCALAVWAIAPLLAFSQVAFAQTCSSKELAARMSVRDKAQKAANAAEVASTKKQASCDRDQNRLTEQLNKLKARGEQCSTLSRFQAIDCIASVKREQKRVSANAKPAQKACRNDLSQLAKSASAARKKLADAQTALNVCLGSDGGSKPPTTQPKPTPTETPADLPLVQFGPAKEISPLQFPAWPSRISTLLQRAFSSDRDDDGILGGIDGTVNESVIRQFLARIQFECDDDRIEADTQAELRAATEASVKRFKEGRLTRIEQDLFAFFVLGDGASTTFTFDCNQVQDRYFINLFDSSGVVSKNALKVRFGPKQPVARQSVYQHLIGGSGLLMAQYLYETADQPTRKGLYALKDLDGPGFRGIAIQVAALSRLFAYYVAAASESFESGSTADTALLTKARDQVMEDDTSVRNFLTEFNLDTYAADRLIVLLDKMARLRGETLSAFDDDDVQFVAQSKAEVDALKSPLCSFK